MGDEDKKLEYENSNFYSSDVSNLAKNLNENLEKWDVNDSLHSTILSVGDVWKRKIGRSSSLWEDLNGESQVMERNNAFDLLDALSRSGNLSVDDVDIHIVAPMTHVFDNTLVNM